MTIVMAASGAVAAQERRFDLPAQPLENALAAYAVATGIQLIYDTSLVRGRRASAVHGRFGRHEALILLVSGTGLTPGYTGPSSITLDPADPPPGNGVTTLRAVNVVAPPTVSFRRYGLAVQNALRRAIERDPAIRNETFQAAVRVWITPQGDVARTVLHRSSGRPEIDAALLSACTGTVIGEPPPPGLAVPVTVSVQAQPRSVRRPS